MKTALVVVLAVGLVGLGAPGANAQHPYVQAYFSVDPYKTAMDCPGPGLQELYVVAHNYATFLIAIEYSVSLPPELLYTGFSSSATLQIGDPVLGAAPDYIPGVSLSWNYPQPAFSPMLVGVLSCIWNCEGCGDPSSVVVGPHQVTGYLSALTWPGITVRTDGIGMVSVVCPPAVPVQETSWGQIKALYRE